MINDERFIKLEKRLRRTEVLALTLTLGILVLLVTASFDSTRPKTVRATRFVLLDDKGVEAGTWEVAGGTPRLAMLSRDGRSGLSLFVRRATDSGNGLNIFDEKVHAAITVQKPGDSKESISMLDLGSNERRAELMAGDIDGSPSFHLMRDARVMVSAEAGPASSAVEVKYGDNSNSLRVP